ncbi:hypothetical protein HanLR1_Chr10g0344071 [Helianthus annuus]|nr:hypothetical protein HanLR1_Chr10g0344071 [Helianthus annuus]
MAPKAQKRKPATKKTNKTEEQIMSEPRHNMVAFLDPEGKQEDYKEITQWLRESRINKAITFSTPVYKSLIKAFWETAQIIEVEGKEVIQGQVHQLNVDVSPEILNNVLELQDDVHAPFSIPITCTRGCLLRMKCTGNIFARHINKATLPLRYKFLLCVLIQCLSKSRVGYDMAGIDLVGLMVALILNKPFSISQFIFANMKDNLRRTGARTSGNKFWMYPRFIQMIMNVQHPDFSKENNDILKVDIMPEQALPIFKGFSSKKYQESDPPRKMFGALAKKDYVAPADDKWRHNDSQSDDEEPSLKKKMHDKFGRKKSDGDSFERDSDDNDDGGNGGDAGATVASAPGTGDAEGGDEQGSTSDDSQPEPGYDFFTDDTDYVPSDTKAEQLKGKKTAARRKKKAKKYMGTSSQPSGPQQEPTQEAQMDPNLDLTTIRSSEPTLVVSSAPEAPVVTSSVETPSVAPQGPRRSIASSIRETTSQPAAERRQCGFEQMPDNEKMDFLFSQLQAAAGQINTQRNVINLTRAAMLKQEVKINTLNSTVDRQQAEIEQLKAENASLKAADEARERQSQQMRAADNTRGIEMNRMNSKFQRLAEDLEERHDLMKQWNTIVDGVKKINASQEILRKQVNTLWSERCKPEEVLRKRDHDSEDQGNPDHSATSQQPPASASTDVVVS